ncbi:hypothetical protein BGZ73_004008 [Actinomortierella ambigua]|nr:hypothetical protein BGZ73_004008 [Actinomortierella ambigua]
MTFQNPERAAQSTSVTSTPAPTTPAQELGSDTATGAAETQGAPGTVATEHAISVSADDPTVVVTANNGTMTPLLGEATLQAHEAASSSLKDPSTPSTPAPSSATLDDTKIPKGTSGEMREASAGGAESMIQGLDIGAASSQEPSAAFVHGAQIDNIPAAESSGDMAENERAHQHPRYLASTAEFFPVHAQDERVFLDRYTEDVDGVPELQHKVGKLQRQVREMRKFMRGMIQLQVEQYEPAAIKIQAWWRGCLVRKELRRQRAFSWHRVPSKHYKPLRYLTKTELQQSCDRISAPKPSIFVTAEMGAAKEVIAAVKLQAVFRGCLVRRRLQAYRRGMQAAIKIQAVWRGYYTRNLDTRLGVKQLQFRNVKVQKAFARVSLKLQYLQGRIATLEESYPVLQDAQDGLTKDFDDLSDEVDKFRKDFEQGLKQMDEQAAEERELMTLELKAMTDRVKKLEDDLAKAHTNQANTELQVTKLQATVARLTASGYPTAEREDMDNGVMEDFEGNGGDEDEHDDDYEVQYDEEGNRIERPKKPATRRSSNHNIAARPSSSLSARRESLDPRTVTRRASSIHGAMAHAGGHHPSSYSESDSPIPAQSLLHRGSVSSIHSHHSNGGPSGPPPPHPARQNSMPATAARPIVAPSIPGSPDQVLPRGAFPSSYSPTIAHAQAHPRSHSRQGSVQFAASTTDANSSFSGSSSTHHHHHPLHNPHRHSMMAAFPPTGATQQAMMMADTKKFASQDDFEYMQAEVDTLRVNNDKLEAMVRDLTAKVNMLMGVASGNTTSTPIIPSAHMPGGVISGGGGYFPSR